MTDQGRRRLHVEGQADWGARKPRNPLAVPPDRVPTVHLSGPVAPSLTDTEARLRLDRAIADVARRVAALRGQAEAIAARVPPLVRATIDEDESAFTSAQQARDAARGSAIGEVSRRLDDDARRGADRLSATASRLAPGWASAPLTGPWSAPAAAAGPAATARIGQATVVDGVSAPILVPLVSGPGLVLSGDISEVEELVRTLALRFVAQSPLKHIVLEVFDPRLRGVLGGLAGLRNAHAAAFPQPTVDAHSFSERLDRVVQAAVRNVELTRVGGVRTLTDLWRTREVPEGVLHLIVVLDYPYAVDRALQERLLRIAQIGGPAGTSLVVATDPGTAAEQNVDPSALVGRLYPIEARADGLAAGEYQVPARLDPAADPAFVDSVVAGLAAASQSLQGPSIPLHALLEADFARPWAQESGVARTSVDSLDVVIGRTGRDPLTLSFRTENPPHPNLLVGGAVGQGKSNLLLDIVYGLAARYNPEELELHLLDFKRGLEFKRFGPDADGRNWLPHVKVLSLESNQAFGVAVLAHVDAEMERRSALFKASGSNSLNAYRAQTGRLLPRLLLVIDEFHALFEGDDRYVDEAVERMARLAKQGRAYGIHLLLASQTTSGVRGLAIKGDSIFAQFPLRLSLKNTAQESQAILSEGNKAAAELTYRGEVILNRNFGSDPEGSNVRGLAAFADPVAMAELQARLWQQGHGEPPMLFVGSDFAAWDAARDRMPVPRTGRLTLLLGRPIDVTNQPTTLTLERDADQALVIVGPDAQVAAGALNSLIRSGLPQLEAENGSLVLLDGMDPADAAWLDAVEADARRRGLTVVRVGREDIACTLVDVVAPRLADAAGSPMLVVGAGLQRARGMDVSRAPEPEPSDDFAIGVPEWGLDPDALAESGRGVLRRLATDGGLAGVHLVGWWSNLRTLEADLGMTHVGVSRYVTAGLGRDDLKAVAGVMAQPIDGTPRVGLFDRNGDLGLQTVVPFDPFTFSVRSDDG